MRGQGEKEQLITVSEQFFNAAIEQIRSALNRYKQSLSSTMTDWQRFRAIA